MTFVSAEPTPPGAATPVPNRIAGAPISWGVCEVPGWGYQLEPNVVLRQMRELGLAATEFGPEGFLPDDPTAKAATLAGYGLKAVGQFVPVVLHDPGHDPLPEVERAMDGLVAASASTVVIAAATGQEGYDERPVLDESGWSTLLGNLDRITDAASTRGLVATLHPHVGTMVESGEETGKVLAGSRIGLCLDTGHLHIGGGDPVAVAQQHPGRIAHTHLKDVRIDWVRRVQSGEVTYTEAVAGGMYVPLGQGDVDVKAIVTALEDSGYAGWYVLEQDCILAGSPATGSAEPNPVADVRASIEHLLAVADEAAAAGPSAAGE
ncbi:inosose dehydratase [Micromonospora globispora]|uniref:sugar phosphate isomerase/epimerase family protein n=1 Tax=Micromonospora globispora TaxID=1450148 RepID=UPI000D6EC756|nr:sugar phosphate isomerase/epimerase [Micromonospora globispora]PWU59209.1 inosose dehydratase [Micromonospora globispora]RQX05970.1 inosose dehydratase [Micromonospora globispora]